jgi:PAS domain S-box-containing protein
MTRKPPSAGKAKVKLSSLFNAEDESKLALPSQLEARTTRLQRQLSLLQQEYDRLAEENRHLVAAASLVPNGYCELDRRGLITSSNAVFAAMVQTEMHTLQGTAFVSFLPDRYHQQFLSYLHHVFLAPGAQTIELPILSATGDEQHARIDARRSERGDTGIMCCVITSTAGGITANTAGIDMQEGFRSIAEYSPDWKMWFNKDGTLLWINGAVEHITGYAPQECYASADFPYALVSDSDRGAVAEVIAEALRGGEEKDREFQFRRKDGHNIWGALSYHPMFGLDGNRIGFCISVRNIAAQKQIEADARAAHLQLDKLLRERTTVVQRKSATPEVESKGHECAPHAPDPAGQKFKVLWERSLDGMLLVDEFGIVLMVNDTYCRMAGMPRDMLVGKPSTNIYAPDERLFFTTMMNRLRQESSDTIVLERQLRLWDDRVVWLELQLSPFPGLDAQKSILVIAHEMTAQKRIEEKIRLLNTALENRLQDRIVELDTMNNRLSAEMRGRIESEEWIRNFILHCPIVMYIKDAQARILIANKNFEKMFEKDPDLLIGRSNRDIWGPELGDELEQQDFEVLKNAVPKEYLDNINGRMYLTTKFPILRNGLPPLLGGYVQDVTEILAEGKALKLSKQFFERIINALGDLVCVKDSRLRYVLVNDSFVKFTGLSREEVMNKTDYDLFSTDVADMIVSGDAAVLEKQREFLIEEFLTRWDGVQRRILVKKDIYFDEDDQPFIVNLIRDITELRDQEDDIRNALAKEKELSELKSRFVSMVSHEYKTPLTAILSSAELLELFRKSWSDEKVDSHLQKIKRAVETMIEMISDALFLNKMETGKLTVSPNTFELVSFCIMIVDEIQACAPAQNAIKFSSTVTHALVTIDNKFLRYIFTNLLSNAVKYSFDHSVVLFDMSIVGQTGIFRVSNQGIGIPHENRERLFEPFFRAQNTGTIQGTGLGLSIVKRCVDSLHGTVEVESVQNETTTFTVTLPMHVLEQQADKARTDQVIHPG